MRQGMLRAVRILSASALTILLIACSGGGASRPATPGGQAGQAGAVKVEPATPAELERIDVFGSKKLRRDAVLARWGDRLAQLARHPERSAEKAAIEAEIKATGGLAFVDIAMFSSVAPKTTYTTVDLVDDEDRARRMTFTAEPTGTHGDPDGLIALWDEYEAKVLGMMVDGTIPPSADDKCPFWHCISFGHASLHP